MRPLILLRAAVVALLIAVPAGVCAGDWSGTIVAANERDSSLSFIAWPESKESRLAVPIAPHNVQATADGALLLAVGAESAHDGHAAHAGGGHLVIVDPAPAKPAVVATIALSGHPAHVVADPRSRFAFVTDATSNAVVVIDLAARAVAGTIPVGRYPHGLRMSPVGQEIYVANMRDASVSVVDAGLRKEIARIRVGRVPVQVGFTPDGKTAFVSLNGENAVAIIDTARRTVVSKRPVGRGPVQVYSSADGKTIYVANQGTEKRPDNRLSLVPVSASARARSLITGAGAHGVSVSEDGAVIAVTNTYAGTVSIVDATTAKVTATIPVGAGPNGVTMLRARAP